MNSSIRFKQHTTNSFFGDFLYDQTVPETHFLRKAKDLINWQPFTNRCLKWYHRSGGVGRPPYNPSVLLRMLLVSYLYNLSERSTELAVNDTLSMKYFVGLGANELAPDHSSLTKFRERLLRGGGQTAYDQLLKEILKEAVSLGVSFGSIQIVDATHTVTDVNTKKDQERKNNGQPPRDPDAKWGVKRTKKIKDTKGKTRNIPDYFYGYKTHSAVNAKSRLITSIKTTSGQENDGKHFQTLVAKDRFAKGLNQRNLTYTADKGYDDGDNHEYLKQKKLGDGIILNDYRINKKNQNKDNWIKLQQSQTYQQAIKLRKQIEKVFGLQKQSHGFRRCRYLGLANYGVQARLTAFAYNLKVVVAYLTGTTQRGYVYAGNCARSSPA